MSDNPKITRLEARINEIMTRPTYASTPAWRQEVAELRLQIEAIRSGRDVERKSPPQHALPSSGPAAALAVEAAAPVDSGSHEEAHEEHHEAPYGFIFFTLAALTLIEWKLAEWFHVRGVALWVGLSGMALFKALLVALYFMHLKFEKRLIIGLLMLPIALVVVMLILVSPDAHQHWWDYLYLNFGG